MNTTSNAKRTYSKPAEADIEIITPCMLSTSYDAFCQEDIRTYVSKYWIVCMNSWFCQNLNRLYYDFGGTTTTWSKKKRKIRKKWEKKKETENNKIELAVGQNGLIIWKSTCLGSYFYKILDHYLKNFSSLEVFLSELERKPLARALTETSCNENTNKKALVLKGYQKTVECNRAKRGAGVEICIKKQHKYQIIKRTKTIIYKFYR